MKDSTLKDDLLWHLNNALTKKTTLLPFLAPCHLALFILSYTSLYLSYFLKVVSSKTEDEKQAYFAKVAPQMVAANDKAIFAFYALAASTLYWFLFGFGPNPMNLTPWEFLNLPTYAIGAIPYQFVNQLAIQPVHYVQIHMF